MSTTEPHLNILILSRPDGGSIVDCLRLPSDGLAITHYAYQDPSYVYGMPKDGLISDEDLLAHPEWLKDILVRRDRGEDFPLYYHCCWIRHLGSKQFTGCQVSPARAQELRLEKYQKPVDDLLADDIRRQASIRATEEQERQLSITRSAAYSLLERAEPGEWFPVGRIEVELQQRSRTPINVAVVCRALESLTEEGYLVTHPIHGYAVVSDNQPTNSVSFKGTGARPSTLAFPTNATAAASPRSPDATHAAKPSGDASTIAAEIHGEVPARLLLALLEASCLPGSDVAKSRNEISAAVENGRDANSMSWAWDKLKDLGLISARGRGRNAGTQLTERGLAVARLLDGRTRMSDVDVG
jgi:hypothetical protein